MLPPRVLALQPQFFAAGLKSTSCRRRCGVHDVRAEGPSASKGDASAGFSEDLLARLKAAEEESQRLKKELADARAQTTAEDSASDAVPLPQAAKRIDSGDLRRETLAFVESKERNWLNETDMDFFTGGGPSEAEGAAAASEEEAAVVRRRLLIGLALSAAACAFALVPTGKLQAPPPKPLFFYLVPLIRVQGLLDDVERVISEGDDEQLARTLARIQGPPNNALDSLRSAAASLPDPRQAEAAEAVGRDVYEYLRGMDYQTYYDSPSRGGRDRQQLVDYSLRSLAAARRKLAEFLALMPREQVEAAAQQVAGSPF